MKKLLLILAAGLLSVSALAQTYPSPTFSSMTLQNPSNLGTPSTIVLTNGTGLPVAGLTGLGTGVATALGAAVTGSGSVVLSASPTFTTSLNATTSTTAVTVAPNTPVMEFSNPGDTGHFADFYISQTNAGPHTTTDNSPLTISSLVGGSGSNAPASYDNGLTVSLIKQNWPTSTTLGGLNGMNIITRQGYDDSDAITVNTGGVAGFFSVMEGQTNQFQATTGTVLQSMDVQIGGIETGYTGTASANGYVANAGIGTLGSGLLVQSVSGAGWTNAIQVGPNGGGASTFTLTPAGNMTLGATGSSKTFRVTSDVLNILNNAQTTELLTLDDNGDLGVQGTFNGGAITSVSQIASTLASGTGLAITANATIGGTLAVTGATTVTGGIVGTTAGGNATAGTVGEYMTANASSVSLTSGNTVTVASITLTPGDWDVTGDVLFTPAGTTTISLQYGGISTTAATLGSLGTYNQDGNSSVAGSGSGFSTPIVRENVTTNTPVYLVAQGVFGTSTMAVGGVIRARRMR